MRGWVIAILILIVLIAAGVGALFMWKPATPKQHIETVIPNARLGH